MEDFAAPGKHNNESEVVRDVVANDKSPDHSARSGKIMNDVSCSNIFFNCLINDSYFPNDINQLLVERDREREDRK